MAVARGDGALNGSSQQEGRLGVGKGPCIAHYDSKICQELRHTIIRNLSQMSQPR